MINELVQVSSGAKVHLGFGLLWVMGHTSHWTWVVVGYLCHAYEKFMGCMLFGCQIFHVIIHTQVESS